MIHYFYGPDTYGARQAVDELAKNTKASLRWIDKEETEKLSPGQWMPQGETSLFGVHLTVIRDASRLPKDTQEMIAQAVSKKSLTDCVIWDRYKPDKRTVLYKNLKKYEKEFHNLTKPQLVSWLMAEAKQKDGVIEADGASLLVDKIGEDRFMLQSELDKLLLTESVITRESVDKMVDSLNIQAEIFTMLDALTAGHSARALTIIEDLLRAGEPELRIMSMVTHQFRSLMLVREGLMQGKNADQIVNYSGLHPYVVKKSMVVASRHSRQYYVDVLTRAMASDFAMKQGKIDMRTGLVMFVISLGKKHNLS